MDQERDLEDGLLAMHEIDPSPVDEDEEHDDFVIPAAVRSGSSSQPSQPKRPNLQTRSSSTLGLHGHSAVYYRKHLLS